MKSYRSRQAAPSADRFSGGLPVPAIHIDLSDGFDHDDVVLHVNNREAGRGSDVTTNLTVSHAASFDVLRPEGRCALWRGVLCAKCVSGDRRLPLVANLAQQIVSPNDVSVALYAFRRVAIDHAQHTSTLFTLSDDDFD
jgi:hypothetical protein